MIPEGFIRLLSHAEILQRTKLMADELRPHLNPANTVLVAVLDGALFFLADLMHDLALDVKVDFLRVKSYQGESSGDLHLATDLSQSVAGADVVLLDDILDTGKTLAFCVQHIKAKGAASVRAAVLLAKERPRLAQVDAPAVGFTIPDRYVIGHGLDLDGRHRHFREIYIKEADKDGRP